MGTDFGTRLGAGAPREPDQCALWYRSRAARRFLLARFVPLVAALSLLWETAQLPLYTIWRESGAREQLFAVVHCTAGDVMIAIQALLLSVMLSARHGWPRLGHGRVLGIATSIGVAYTVLSEWVNTQVTMSWQYAESMLQIPPLGTGIAPLLQWIVVPPLAYWLATVVDRTKTRRGD
jgi:hypothetical protein